MPVNSFTVGRDTVLTIVTASGPLSLSLITGFQANQDSAEIKVKGLDGITRHARMFDGWHGSFSVERQDNTLDDYFAQLEAAYYGGVAEQPATITQTITETSGAVTQYRYLQVLLKYDDAGSYAGDSTVKQKMSFVASRRLKVA